MKNLFFVGSRLNQRSSSQKTPRFAQICLAASVVFGGFLCAKPIAAQDLLQPPAVSAVDERGVDLATGKFRLPNLDVSIGASGSGLARQTMGDSDNQVGFITVYVLPSNQYTTDGPAVADISFAGNYYRFYVGQGQYGTNQQAMSWYMGNGEIYSPSRPARLLCSPNSNYTSKTSTCTLTTPDGTIAEFTSALNSVEPAAVARGADTWGILTRYTKPDGEVVEFDYNTNVNGSATGIRNVRSSLGWTLKYERDGVGLYGIAALNSAQNYCDPAALSCPNTLPDVNRVKRTVSGDTTTLFYNDEISATYTIVGNTVTLTSPEGLTKTVVYSGTNTNGKVASVTVGGQTWTYSFVTASDITTGTVTAPDGTTEYAKTSAQNIVETKLAGLITTYEYDSPGVGSRITKVVHPGGNSATGGYTLYEYGGGLSRVSKVTAVPKGGTAATGLVTQATYTSWCDNTNFTYCTKPLTVKDHHNVTTTYTYETFGSIKDETRTAVNGVQSQTRYFYSQFTPRVKASGGNMVNQPPVWRLTSTKSCMSLHLATCLNGTDELVNSTAYGTDNVLPVSTTTRRGDNSYAQTSLYGYTFKGQVKTVDGPKTGDADKIFKFYDAIGRETGVIGIDPDGTGPRPRVARQVDHDLDGKVTEEITGTTSSTSLANFAPLEKTVTQYNSTTGLPITSRYYTFESNAYVLKKVSQQSYTNMFQVDCSAQRLNPSTFSALPEACTPATAGADGPDRITKYYYDTTGRVVKTVSGFGVAPINDFVKVFNSDGTIANISDAKGNKTVYEYDGFNRPKKTIYPLASNGASSNANDYEQVTYSGARVQTFRRRDGQTFTFAYDALGRVSSKTGPINESFSYNNFNQTLSHTNNGVTSTYTYNSLGWLLSDQQSLGTVSYEYDAYGRRSKMTYPGGFYVGYLYNEGDELTRQCVNSVNCAVAMVSYAYDNLGRRSHLYRAGGPTTTYAYDTSSRLTGLNNPINAVTLSYSMADQIKTRTNSYTAMTHVQAAGNITSYNNNALNQLTGVGGSTLSYDARGNLTSDGAVTYTYNVNNLLTSTSSGAALSYDAENRLARVARSGFTPTRFLYDGADLIAEYDDAGTTVLRRYVHGPGSDEPLLWYQNFGDHSYRYLLSDERGSITGTTIQPAACKATILTTNMARPRPATTAASNTLAKPGCRKWASTTTRPGFIHRRWAASCKPTPSAMATA